MRTGNVMANPNSHHGFCVYIVRMSGPRSIIAMNISVAHIMYALNRWASMRRRWVMGLKLVGATTGVGVAGATAGGQGERNGDYCSDALGYFLLVVVTCGGRGYVACA